MEIVKIRKGWFYSAGEFYGWSRDGFDKRGVGISKSYLVSNEKIVVEVEGEKFSVDCLEAINFISKYGSFKQMGKRAVVGIVSKTVLVPYIRSLSLKEQGEEELSLK